MTVTPLGVIGPSKRKPLSSRVASNHAGSYFEDMNGAYPSLRDYGRAARRTRDGTWKSKRQKQSRSCEVQACRDGCGILLDGAAAFLASSVRSILSLCLGWRPLTMRSLSIRNRSLWSELMYVFSAEKQSLQSEVSSRMPSTSRSSSRHEFGFASNTIHREISCSFSWPHLCRTVVHRHMTG